MGTIRMAPPPPTAPTDGQRALRDAFPSTVARVVASVDNPGHVLRPGMFVTAYIPFQQIKADIVVPKSAVQSVEGQSAVFVRTSDGFEPRKIVTGREDSKSFEVTSGLTPGDRIATANTFVLKADLGRSEAGHAH